MPSDEMEFRVASLLTNAAYDDRSTYQVLRDAGLTVVESDRLALAEAVVEAARKARRRLAYITDQNADVPAAREARWAISDIDTAIAAHDSGAVEWPHSGPGLRGCPICGRINSHDHDSGAAG